MSETQGSWRGQEVPHGDSAVAVCRRLTDGVLLLGSRAAGGRPNSPGCACPCVNPGRCFRYNGSIAPVAVQSSAEECSAYVQCLVYSVHRVRCAEYDCTTWSPIVNKGVGIGAVAQSHNRRVRPVLVQSAARHNIPCSCSGPWFEIYGDMESMTGLPFVTESTVLRDDVWQQEPSRNLSYAAIIILPRDLVKRTNFSQSRPRTVRKSFKMVRDLTFSSRDCPLLPLTSGTRLVGHTQFLFVFRPFFPLPCSFSYWEREQET